MTKDEALKLALAVLKEWRKGFPDDWTDFDTEAVTAIREALARPEQLYPDNFIDALKYDVAKRDSEAEQQKLTPYMVHAHGAIQRMAPRKPLTDKEIEAIHQSTWMQSTATLNDFARAIEAAHGIKG